MFHFRLIPTELHDAMDSMPTIVAFNAGESRIDRPQSVLKFAPNADMFTRPKRTGGLEPIHQHASPNCPAFSLNRYTVHVKHKMLIGSARKK